MLAGGAHQVPQAGGSLPVAEPGQRGGQRIGRAFGATGRDGGPGCLAILTHPPKLACGLRDPQADGGEKR